MAAGYAIRALVCLAGRPGEWVRGASAIAASIDAPKPYLVKVLHTLRRHGMIETRRGIHGGYRLSKSPVAITLRDVIVAIDGPEVFERCLLGHGKCSPRRNCGAHPFWSKERVRIERECRELTLARLASADDGKH